MFDHISIGVADIGRARRFYDNALKPIGYALLSEGETSLGYGKGSVGFWILQVEHPVPPDPRSGLHFCFSAPDVPSVAAFHRAALAAGGTDNGLPGHRDEYGADYYAAYVIDPDGYRLEAYHAHERG
jgi:catechol 2,3-dioxygenase-like lactoylglutathione lyase family enzyme